MALTDTNIRNLKSSGLPTKHSDGGGLHVLLTPNGSKLWRLSYRFEGKQKTLALGAYPAVSLAAARKKREEAKALLAAGTDPGTAAKAEKAAKLAVTENTFRTIADELLAKNQKEGKAETTLNKKRWLLDMACADLGSRPMTEITAKEILGCLRKIEAVGNLETARRMRGTIGQVFRYAIATARAQTDPTRAGFEERSQPPRSATMQPSLPRRGSALIRAVWAYDGMPETRIALQLMALLFPRPGELRQAEWSEFDLEAATWTIPASRMKMRREHKKPLSSAAVDLLKELQKLTGGGPLAFPAVHTRQRPMSENTLNTALRRMGYTKEEHTSHGFRSSASSLLNESGKWNPDAIEAELAHVGADQVRKAYHRATYWDERVRMAEWWSGELDRLQGEKAVPVL
ncbi:UNVERIFIED_ORG: integrase [Martelella mediterranea]